LVKVVFKPWEEVIIHESILYTFDDFVKICSIGVQPGGMTPPLTWADGVVFRIGHMQPTDEVIKEQLEGKVHYGSVEWALMPQYKNVIPIGDINAKIPVIDVSKNAILSDVAKALKERK
jgi:hypothetical protein